MEIGSLISYYDDGWRYGYLVEYEEKRTGKGKATVTVRTGFVKVRPIAAFKQGTPRLVSVPLSDIKESDPFIKEAVCLRRKR